MRGIAQVALLVWIGGFGVLRAPAASGEDSPGPGADALRAARDKAVAFLRTKQDAQGTWGTVGGNSVYGDAGGSTYLHPLGATCLAMYALLVSGVPKDDPAVKKGLASLPKADLGFQGPSAYEMSAELLAVAARAKGPPGWRHGGSASLEAADRKQGQDLVDALLRMRANASTQGWRYDLRGKGKAPGGEEDLSSTGLAAIALYTADRCGLKVPAALWPELVAFAKRQQDAEGEERDRAVGEASASGEAGTKDRARGFAYMKSPSGDADEGQATGGVTAAGIATIQCARLALGKKSFKGWASKEQADARQALLDGAAWLDANWDPSKNPRKKKVNIYHVLYLVHVADAMDLLGSSRLGSHDWFAEMAQALLDTQKEDGSWDTNSTHSPRDVLDTCFALLFLARPFAAAPPTAPAGK